MADIRIGISGWTYKPWRGDFYPKGLPQRQELELRRLEPELRQAPEPEQALEPEPELRPLEPEQRPLEPEQAPAPV